MSVLTRNRQWPRLSSDSTPRASWRMMTPQRSSERQQQACRLWRRTFMASQMLLLPLSCCYCLGNDWPTYRADLASLGIKRIMISPQYHPRLAPPSSITATSHHPLFSHRELRRPAHYSVLGFFSWICLEATRYVFRSFYRCFRSNVRFVGTFSW